MCDFYVGVIMATDEEEAFFFIVSLPLSLIVWNRLYLLIVVKQLKRTNRNRFHGNYKLMSEVSF